MDCFLYDNDFRHERVKVIMNLIKNKNILYKSYTANESSTDKKETVKVLQNMSTSIIKNSNPETSSKAYWSILRSFLSEKKKIPVVSLLYRIGNFNTEFHQRVEPFNSFFAQKPSIIGPFWN